MQLNSHRFNTVVKIKSELQQVFDSLMEKRQLSQIPNVAGGNRFVAVQGDYFERYIM